MLAKHLYHRRTEALKIRTEAAQISTLSEYPSHVSNGEEQDYSNAGGPSFIANYSKGLPHNAFGEVNRRAYRAMVRALHSRDPQLFEQIPKGRVLGRNLTNPQAGLAFDLEGPDGQAIAIPPAPRIDGQRTAEKWVSFTGWRYCETSASSTTAPALEPMRVLTIPGPRRYP
ncbi:hypothetical protein [Bradyrhizobium sp. 157]|uniref:hypothetical protein n=1 Tax=Bradyrhizobium sp. 157 TaxID=2782631 RepID=UPI001FFA633B|nr:hypothetical protein [Bradyrhizobium sp. 157]